MAEIQTVGRVGVAVQPDLSKFARDTRAGITSALRNLRVEVPIVPDVDRLRQGLETAVRQASAGVVAQVRVAWVPVVAVLRAELERLVAAASRGATARVDVEVDGSGVRRALSSLTGSSGGGGPGRVLAGLSRSFSVLSRSVASLGAAAGAVQVVGGLASALAQLAPVALALPGLLAGVAAGVATTRLALQGFSEAVASGDLSALAPSAQEAARAVRALRDEFSAVQQSVQSRFFENLAGPIRETGSVLLPILNTGLSDIAGQLNTVARGALEAARNPFFQDDLSTILGNTAGLFREIGSGVGDLLSGLVGLGSVGSEYLPRLGEAIGSVTARFRAWVDSGVEDGSIRRLIDNAIQGFQDLGAIIGNLGSIAGSIFSGLSAGSGATSFLATLRDTSAALAEFFASAAAQGPLQALGQTMAVAGAAVRDILLAALRAIGPVIEAAAPFVQAFASALGTALPAALDILGPPLAALVQALAGALSPLLPILAQAFVGLASALAPVVEALIPVVEMIGQTLAPIMAQLLPLVVEIATAFGEYLAVAIASLAPILPPLIEAVGQVLAAVLPLIPPLIELAADIFPLLAGIMGSVVVPAVQLVAGAIQALAPFISIAIDSVRFFVAVLTGDFGRAMEIVRGVPQRILGALGGLGNLLVSAGRAILDGFLRGLRAAWDGVRNFVGGIADWIRRNKGPLSYDKRLLIPAGRAIMDGLYRGLESEYGKVQDLVSGVADGIAGTFSEPIDVSIRADADRMVAGLPIGSYSAELQTALSADGFGIDYDRLTDSLIAGMTGSTWRVEGSGLATIVNKENLRRRRR